MTPYDRYLQVRDSLADRPGLQKEFIEIMNEMMLDEPQLFQKYFSGDIKQSNEVVVAISRELAVMEGRDPNELVFRDASIDRTLYKEAKQLAHHYNGDMVRAVYHLWDEFKEAGDKQNADIANSLLQKVLWLQELEKEQDDKNGHH